MSSSRSLFGDALFRLLKNRAAKASIVILCALVLGCIFIPEFSSYRYDKTDLALGPTPPSMEHWMGTDYAGRDLMVRVFLGGRISFAVGIIATVLSFMIGSLWGGIAGYAGGKTDAWMMRIVDILYTLPFLVFVILLMVFFGNDKSVFYQIYKFVLGIFVKNPGDSSYFPLYQIAIVFMALGCISWLTMARIVRGQVLSLKNQPFIEAARCLGLPAGSIVFKHLLPNAMGPMIVYTALTIPEVMMTEAFLSFLGLGTQEPLSSLGLLAAQGAETMDVYPYQLFFPSIFLALTLFCFHFLGDGLKEALDPRAVKH